MLILTVHDSYNVLTVQYIWYLQIKTLKITIKHDNIGKKNNFLDLTVIN
jgi:hypothetical protein